jgi:hypothetical protein
MRRTLISLGAIALLVVGVGAAYAATDPASGTAATTTTVGTFGFADRDGLLDEVLADLVTDGTITESQSTAITDALTAARDARIAEMEALHETMQTIIEDGVITTEELAQLPDDHPFNQLDDLLDDGQITLDELRGLGGFGFGGPGHGHHGFMWQAPGTTDSTDDSSDS